MQGKQPTGKEEDFFISISLSAAPSLLLSLRPGYRKYLVFSSIVARISPSEHHMQTDSHKHTQTKLEILFLQRNDWIQWGLNMPIWHHQKAYLGAPTESAQKMLCQLRGRKAQIHYELMISIT